jgi:glycosyltransferase involved in cell wall biosynthesis
MVTQSFPKYPGDATAPFMGSIANALAARGHTINVVLPHHPEFQYPPGDGVRFFPYRYSPSDRFAPWGFGESLKGASGVSRSVAPFLPAIALSLRRRIKQRLAAEAYDVVHANWVIPNGWLAASPARARRVPLVISLHGSDVALAERNRLLGSLASRAFAAAGAVTACSEDLHRRAVALGADPATTATVHYGVDTEAFAPGEPDAAARARLGASPEQLLVVTVGRLVEKKGFRYLIEAAARVPDAHVAIVGDGDLRADLERRVRDSGASVTFTGNRDHDGVAEALGAADVVAIPSVVDSAGNVDGLPNTLLEALSAGRAVVATRLAGIPEVVTDRSNGLLVAEKDVDALAQALSELEDRDLRERLGAEARRRAVAELDWASTAGALEEAFARAGRLS